MQCCILCHMVNPGDFAKFPPAFIERRKTSTPEPLKTALFGAVGQRDQEMSLMITLDEWNDLPIVTLNNIEIVFYMHLYIGIFNLTCQLLNLLTSAVVPSCYRAWLLKAIDAALPILQTARTVQACESHALDVQGMFDNVQVPHQENASKKMGTRANTLTKENHLFSQGKYENKLYHFGKWNKRWQWSIVKHPHEMQIQIFSRSGPLFIAFAIHFVRTSHIVNCEKTSVLSPCWRWPDKFPPCYVQSSQVLAVDERWCKVKKKLVSKENIWKYGVNSTKPNGFHSWWSKKNENTMTMSFPTFQDLDQFLDFPWVHDVLSWNLELLRSNTHLLSDSCGRTWAYHDAVIETYHEKFPMMARKL